MYQFSSVATLPPILCQSNQPGVFILCRILHFMYIHKLSWGWEKEQEEVVEYQLEKE